MSEENASAYDPENLEVLLRLTSGGDTLTKPRDVNFSVGFAEAASASDFCKQMQQLGYRAYFGHKEQFAPFSWDATVVVSLIPSEESIGEFELLLAHAAAPLSGKNDGWFCERIVDDPNVSRLKEAVL